MSQTAKPTRNFWGRTTWRGMKPGASIKPAAVTVPRGIGPDDLSPEACAARVNFHVAMAQLNPNGRRQHRLRDRANSRPNGLRRHRRHLRSVVPQDRLSMLMTLAKLAGKAGIVTRIKQMVKA